MENIPLILWIDSFVMSLDCNGMFEETITVPLQSSDSYTLMLLHMYINNRNYSTWKHYRTYTNEMAFSLSAALSDHAPSRIYLRSYM